MKSFIVAGLFVASLFTAQVQAQECRDGRCGLVRQVVSVPVNAVAHIVQAQPVRTTARAVVESQPVRTVAQAVYSARPVHMLKQSVRFGLQKVHCRPLRRLLGR